jgi:hypothetical protein
MRRIVWNLMAVCMVAAALMSCSMEEPDGLVQPDASHSEAPAANATLKAGGGGDGNIYYAHDVVLSGTTHVGVILAEFADTSVDYPTNSFLLNPGYQQIVMDAVVGGTGSVDQLYEQMSGHLPTPHRFTAGWVATVEIDSSLRGTNSECGSSIDDWNLAARSAAVAQGADLGLYECTMVVMSTDNHCNDSNWLRSQAFHSTDPPSVVINNWDYSDNDYSHELGHLLGFGHSNTPVFDYWDYSCLMGENAEYDGNGVPINPIPPRQLNVVWKIAAGYIDPATEMLTITGGGTSTAYLAPSEYSPSEVVDPQDDQAYRAIRVDGDQETYYLSYRQPRPPFDSDPAGPSPLDQTANRIHVHRFLTTSNDGFASSELLKVLQADPGLDTYEQDDFSVTVLSDGLDGDVDYVEVEISLSDCSAELSASLDEPVIYQATTPRFPSSPTFDVEVFNPNGATCGSLNFGYWIEPVSGDGWEPSPTEFTYVDIPAGGTSVVNPKMVFFQDPGDGVFEGDIHYSGQGVEATTVRVAWYLDRVDPTTPLNVNVDLVGDVATITWNDSYDITSGVSHYELRNGATVLDPNIPTNQTVYTLPAEGEYAFGLVAYDAAGNQSGVSVPETVTYDVTPPTVPAGLTAALNGCTVDLSWEAANDTGTGVSGYEIYKDGAYLAQTGDLFFSEVVNGAAAGSSLSYQVLAVDGAGNSSGLSAAADVALPDIVITKIKVARTNALTCTTVVTWTTNLPTSSVVRYDDTCHDYDFQYEFVATGADNVTSHSVECHIYDVQAFAFVVESSDGCVKAQSDCEVKARGMCLSQ